MPDRKNADNLTDRTVDHIDESQHALLVPPLDETAYQENEDGIEDHLQEMHMQKLRCKQAPPFAIGEQVSVHDSDLYQPSRLLDGKDRLIEVNG